MKKNPERKRGKGGPKSGGSGPGSLPWPGAFKKKKVPKSGRGLQRRKTRERRKPNGVKTGSRKEENTWFLGCHFGGWKKERQKKKS